MARQKRRHVALDRLDRLAGIGAGHDEEYVGDAVEVVTAFFQRNDGVVESGRGRVGGDGIKLGAVRGQRPVEGRAKMLGRQRREGRQAKGTGPVGKQRVLGGGGI